MRKCVLRGRGGITCTARGCAGVPGCGNGPFSVLFCGDGDGELLRDFDQKNGLKSESKIIEELMKEQSLSNIGRKK